MHGNMVAKAISITRREEEAFQAAGTTRDVAVPPRRLHRDPGPRQGHHYSGGENSPIEVEQVVSPIPGLEAAVIAIPDEKWGERPKAFVSLKKDRRRPKRRSRLLQDASPSSRPQPRRVTELPKHSTA